MKKQNQALPQTQPPQVEEDLMDDKDPTLRDEINENIEEENSEVNQNIEADPSAADLPPGFWVDPEDTKVFRAVDRNSEDLAVVRYQNLRDDRNEKSQQLLALRRKTLQKWSRTFRELGRTQSLIESRLVKTWEQCLLARETNGRLDFPVLLNEALLATLETVAIQGKKMKLWERLKPTAPPIEQLEEEETLLQAYVKVVDQMNDLLGELYILREPTMKVWAKRYYYLASSEEEMFAELRLVWVKCVNEYEYEAKERVVSTRGGHHVHYKGGEKKTVMKKTSFNTYKFNAFRNFIINQLKKKYKCKKRIDEKGVPYEQTMLSLDHQYEQNGDDGVTLHDIVPGSLQSQGRSLAADMLIDRIVTSSPMKKDHEMRFALEKLVYDPHIKSLEMACRLRSGSINVNTADRDLIYSAQVTKDESWKTSLANLIITNGLYTNGFSVVSAQIWPKSIAFEVKVRDASLLLRTKKAIKAAKLEKEFASL